MLLSFTDGIAWYVTVLTLQQPACSALKLRQRSCVWRFYREQLQATRGTLALTDGSGPEVMLVKSGDPVTFEAISRRGAKVRCGGCAGFGSPAISAVILGLLVLKLCMPGMLKNVLLRRPAACVVSTCCSACPVQVSLDSISATHGEVQPVLEFISRCIPA